jgi:hypothetical protein
MNAASMSYEAPAGPVPGITAACQGHSGTTGTVQRGQAP